MIKHRSIKITTDGPQVFVTDAESKAPVKGVRRVVMDCTLRGRKCTLEFINAEMEGEFLAPGVSGGVQLIALERKRQVEQEGWTHEHDAEHVNGELAQAAACYCMVNPGPAEQVDLWPDGWSIDDFKRTGAPQPSDRDLIRAGALIAAELDRRAAAAAVNMEAGNELA